MKFDFCQNCLTDEEKAVLDLRRRGWRNAEIAAELYCSERTVNRRVRNIKNKLR
uniref:Helix-turn-helix protein n=1 Tax=Ackermannviridae sp. TaxID=2831612 RepID=A0A8S5RTG0_9CAUD|nr:MAG TPA: helix-turn-helix protein [Ackermannviridae sp.]